MKKMIEEAEKKLPLKERTKDIWLKVGVSISELKLPESPKESLKDLMEPELSGWILQGLLDLLSRERLECMLPNGNFQCRLALPSVPQPSLIWLKCSVGEFLSLWCAKASSKPHLLQLEPLFPWCSPPTNLHIIPRPALCSAVTWAETPCGWTSGLSPPLGHVPWQPSSSCSNGQRCPREYKTAS